MRGDRHLPLHADRPLQLDGIGRRLPPRGAEVDREQRRRRVQQLVPARVHLRRQVVALRIVLVRPELGVMIEVPARELARRDPARRRVQQARARASRPGACARTRCGAATSCSRMVKLKIVKPWTNASGIQMSGFSNRMRPQVASPRIANCRIATMKCRTRRLAMKRAQHVARNRLAELSLQRHRVLRVVVGHFRLILAGHGARGSGIGDQGSGVRAPTTAGARSRLPGSLIPERPSQLTPTAHTAPPAPPAAPSASAPRRRAPRSRRARSSGASGSPRKTTAVAIATIGMTFE